MEILRTKTFQKAYDKLFENHKLKVDDALAPVHCRQSRPSASRSSPERKIEGVSLILRSVGSPRYLP